MPLVLILIKALKRDALEKGIISFLKYLKNEKNVRSKDGDKTEIKLA